MNAPPQTRSANPRRARAATILLLVLSVPLFLVPPTTDDGGSTLLGIRVPDTPGLDKAVHALVFGLLGASGALGWPAVGSARRLPLLLLALLLGYGALVEVLQGAIPGRTASIGDWLADAGGAIAGVALVGLRRRRRSQAQPDAPE